MGTRIVRKKRRSPQFRVWQAVGLSLVIALLSGGIGVTVFFITAGVGDIFLERSGRQWAERFAFALGILFGLGVIALSIADLVKSMKLKAWHLILGTILWPVAIALGIWWWLVNYLFQGMS